MSQLIVAELLSECYREIGELLTECYQRERPSFKLENVNCHMTREFREAFGTLQSCYGLKIAHWNEMIDMDVITNELSFEEECFIRNKIIHYKEKKKRFANFSNYCLVTAKLVLDKGFIDVEDIYMPYTMHQVSQDDLVDVKHSFGFCSIHNQYYCHVDSGCGWCIN